METTVLTYDLLSSLEKQGFTYFIGQSENFHLNDATDLTVRIILTPVRNNPEIEGIPNGYDSWFKIADDETAEMAKGVDKIDFFVNIS